MKMNAMCLLAKYLYILISLVFV